jgi:hypothetical protein
MGGNVSKQRPTPNLKTVECPEIHVIEGDGFGVGIV